MNKPPPAPNPQFQGLLDQLSSTRREHGAAKRNRRQVKEDDVRKIVEADFTAFHLRCGPELNISQSDLWDIAEQDIIDGVDRPPLRMYGGASSHHRGKVYLWYRARQERVQELLDELLGLDAARRLGDDF